MNRASWPNFSWHDSGPEQKIWNAEQSPKVRLFPWLWPFSGTAGSMLCRPSPLGSAFYPSKAFSIFSLCFGPL